MTNRLTSDQIEPGPVPELDSPEQSPHGDTASELRRSSRVSHSPVRFGDTVTFGCCITIFPLLVIV